MVANGFRVRVKRFGHNDINTFLGLLIIYALPSKPDYVKIVIHIELKNDHVKVEFESMK